MKINLRRSVCLSRSPDSMAVSDDEGADDGNKGDSQEDGRGERSIYYFNENRQVNLCSM